MRRGIRITVDLLMFVALVITLVTMRGNMLVHTIAGGLLVALIIIHVILTIKWTIGMTKNFRRINTKLRRQLVVNMTLKATWLICIITGILAGAHTLTGIEALYFVRRVHGITGIIACIITVVHVIQHRKRLITLLKGSKKRTV